ncbi:MAG: hypothetical protein KBC38_03995 [Candidatus Pacebacteria bacterium]|nr:hypothetical protein [Candidatus Paceibacterota bacterium]MBP9840373.1 hypothetical protein [Candidatus Paceibacterota bacterium]
MKTIILFHGHCPDGFGGAYSAWKKFGDSAEYIPLKHGKEPVVVEPGNDLYFIDFCYPKDVMDAIAADAASLTILDHHLGTSEVVKSFPKGHFDNDHSGAVLGWQYFHPDTKVPTLLSYIEDGDLYRHTLPDSRALLAYIHTKPLSFESWDALVAELEDSKGLAAAISLGATYREHYGILASQMIDSAELVSFEGYEIYLASASSAFVSDVGNHLAKKKGPLALVGQVRPDGIRVGIRGDGSVDVAEIARKFGGNGHPSAAGFSLPWGTPIPWTPIEKDEDSRD